MLHQVTPEVQEAIQYLPEAASTDPPVFHQGPILQGVAGLPHHTAADHQVPDQEVLTLRDLLQDHPLVLPLVLPRVLHQAEVLLQEEDSLKQ